ncbi:unnamed protein product [Orchesella dallaii]|uniref:Uncharacterized protein n=1 Tax=Orchesella dallaii TaxID=48710 RepID=A0ABP1PQM2_9HEXA
MFSKTVLALAFLGVLVLVVNGAPQSNDMAAQWAQGAASSGQVGKPQFHVNGGGAGNNGRNWGAHGNIGAGVKAWQSQNGRHSIGVGANVGQSVGRFQGQSWKSRPDYGVGAAYSYRFGGGRRG